jgi:hypothetical protein
MDSDYPLWDRPTFLRDRAIEELSAAEARRYCEWFVDQMSGRVTRLLDRLAVPDGLTWAEKLDQTEKGVARLMQSPRFWNPSVGRQPIQLRHGVVRVDVGETLTEQGAALGLDIGVLIARALEKSIDGLTWGVVRKPRSFVSYNMPVLQSRNPPPFEPHLIGTNYAMGLTWPTSRRATTLADLFSVWRDLLTR